MPTTNTNSQHPDHTRLKRIITLGAMPLLLAALGGGYLVRVLSAHRRPRPVPHEQLWGGADVQLPGDGVGDLFHRRYSVVIDRPRLKKQALMDQIKTNFPEFCPKLLADFKKVQGHPQIMRVGDEYTIGMLGPWNGEVRVVEVDKTQFTFATLEGHPEAGQITFAVTAHPTRPGAIRFEINSWARSRDTLVSLSYEGIKIGKEVQKNVWSIFCEEVVAASGGEQVGDVEVVTEQHSRVGEVTPIV